MGAVREWRQAEKRAREHAVVMKQAERDQPPFRERAAWQAYREEVLDPMKYEQEWLRDLAHAARLRARAERDSRLQPLTAGS